MSSLNKVQLIGNMGAEAKKHTFGEGKTMVTLSIATSSYYTDKSGTRQEETEWHDLVAFDRMADLVLQYTTKGSKLFVEGRLKTNTYTDREGNQRKNKQIVVERLIFLSFPQSRELQSMPGGTDYAKQRALQNDKKRPQPQDFTNQTPNYYEDDLLF